jgi:tripartite-type tricarboxylate transporter receptor subunit TctC
MLTRRSLLLAALTTPLAVPAAHGQTAQWPSGTIRLVVPFAAGGSIDMIARLVQPGLQQRLGNTIIVDNRPGASGSAGAAMVAKSAPDGATWLLCFDSQAINPFLIPNLPFDTEKDLDPVLLIGTGPHVLSTHPSRPYRTFAEVVADAKARPDVITCSNGGTGSLSPSAPGFASSTCPIAAEVPRSPTRSPAMSTSFAAPPPWSAPRCRPAGCGPCCRPA